MTTENTNARVVVSKDGPYLVSGNVPLAKPTIVADSDGGSEAWLEGPALKTPPNYALCRCGQSDRKPFCDGTHTKVGFDGAETASRELYAQQAKVVDGPTMILTDAEQLCASARFCDPNGQVWNQVACSDDLEIRAMFIRQVANCPAGRLVAWNKATQTPIEPELPVSIGLIEDPVGECGGPLWLRGGVAVVSADGFEYERRNRVTLCRCGQSANKPFCDGTHTQIKFRG